MLCAEKFRSFVSVCCNDDSQERLNDKKFHANEKNWRAVFSMTFYTLFF